MSKHVRVFCPNCRNEVRVPPENMGEMGICKHCKQPFRPRAYVRLACPGCQSDLDIRKEYMGRSVSCKHCGQGFVAEIPGTSSDLPASLPGEIAAVLGVAKPRPSRDDMAAAPARLPAELESAQIWKRRAEAAEQERNATRAERDALQQRLDESLGRMETLCAKHESALHEVYEATNAECVALLAELDAERQSRERVEATRAELEADLEALRLEKAGFQDLVEARHHVAETDLLRTEVDREERQAEIEQLTRDLVFAREREETERQSKERLEAARAELESDLETLRLENAGYRDLVEARQHLGETDLLRTDVDRERQAEIERLNVELARARERENTERQAKERLEATRAGMEADLRTIRQEGEGFRRDLVEAWRRLAETDTRLAEIDPEKQAENEQLTRDLALVRERETSEREARERLEAALATLEAELVSLRRQDETNRTDLVEAQRRLAEAESRRPEIDPQRQAEFDQLTRDLALAREREVSEREARERLETARAALETDLEAFRRESDGFRTELVEARRRLAEAESRHPEIDQLSRELAVARQREDQANRQISPLTERAKTLVDELEREKADRERENAQYKRILAHLEKEAEAARTRTASPRPGKSESKLAETLDRLRTSTERGDRLELELQSVRSRLNAVSRDLALAQLYDDDASAGRSAPENRSEELKEAQLRIIQLSEELKRANVSNQKLKDTLDGIGIRFT